MTEANILTTFERVNVALFTVPRTSAPTMRQVTQHVAERERIPSRGTRWPKAHRDPLRASV